MRFWGQGEWKMDDKSQISAPYLLKIILLLSYYISMLYNQFVEKCLATIKQHRQHSYAGIINIDKISIPQQPVNIYAELVGQKGKKKFKLEQWNFCNADELMNSQYGEEDDPELDLFNVPKKSFFLVLEETLKNFNPKLLIKVLEPEKLRLKICRGEKELDPFHTENTYLKEVDEYEGEGYKCKVMLKYDYEDFQEVKIMSSQQEFELLVDESYENDRIDRIKEERKMSEDIISKSKHRQTEKDEKMQSKRKKKEEINKIKEMMKSLEFEEIGDKTLLQFLKVVQ